MTGNPEEFEMKRILAFVACVVMSSAASFGLVHADDWPGFRGASNGVAPEQNLPGQLTKDNILWKVKLPWVGTASPIVANDKLFVTGYTGYGTTISKGFGGGFGGFGKGGFGKGGFGKEGFGKGGPPDPAQKKLKLLVACLDRAAGKILWEKEIEPKLPEVSFSGMIREHGYASSTPVTDGERVIAFFGKSGVYAFDMKGAQLWRADVGSGTHMMGTAASPVLHKDLVIINAAVEGQALVALDKKTGKEAWRVKGLSACWASPILVEAEGGTELVLSLPGKIAGYNPSTGKELWHCQGIGNPGGYGGTSPTPVAKDGVVFVMGGGGPTPAVTIAVKAGGKGDVAKSHVVWRARAGASYCSPVILGDNLCWIDGTIQCLNVADGKSVHKDRLYDARGEYVSAVAAGDKVYALTRLSGLFVLDGAGKFEKMAHLEFDGDESVFNASPAVSDGRLYLRSNAFL
jgi:outer membrane protein assembly factor BamB